MDVFRQSGCIRAKAEVLGQKWLYSVKDVVFGQKWLYSGKNCCIQEKVLYSGKSGLFGQSGCIRAKVVVFC